MCKPKVMGSGNDQRCLIVVLAKTNKGRQCPMSLEYCLHAKGNAVSPDMLIGEQCAKSTKDIGCPRPTLAK